MYNLKEDFENGLEKLGLTMQEYESICKDIDQKFAGENDLDWSDIKDIHGIPLNKDVVRKASGTVFGGTFRAAYERYKQMEKCSLCCEKDENGNGENNKSELDVKIEELRKERIKLQTANIERNRVDRSMSRQEMYYEYVGNAITALPLPEFQPLEKDSPDSKVPEVNYVVGLADVHYGASYKSVNNEYSPEIANLRFAFLTNELINFIQDKKISRLTIVSLGDLIQGCIRLSDLKINDSSVVKATVEICRLIANMLNCLSAYTEIMYYHCPTANHTQVRVLGAKASELADEDLEYLMGNYIKDLCANNERIVVKLANDGDGFIEVYVPGNEVIAMHGHQIKDIENAVKNISVLHKKFYDSVLLGHYHNGKEIPSHEGILGDSDVLISPSFCGSDPYSDSICKGAKAAVKIYGFDKLYGHTETYKIILN